MIDALDTPRSSSYVGEPPVAGELQRKEVANTMSVFSARINGRKKYGKTKKQNPVEDVQESNSPIISFEDSEEDS